MIFSQISGAGKFFMLEIYALEKRCWKFRKILMRDLVNSEEFF